MSWCFKCVALAGGVALGAAGLLFPRFRAPRLTLAVYSASHLEADWLQYMGAFYAVSAKLLTGIEPTSPTVRGLLDQAEGAGLRRHGWGYHYCRDDFEAEAEGMAAAQAANLADVDVYGWNAEFQWGGSWKSAGADDPIRTSTIFAETFHSATSRRRKLAWNAYTTEAARQFKSPHAVLDVPDNVALFDVWAPMIFASSPQAIASEWGSRVRKWSRVFPNLLEAPLVGSGRELQPGLAMGYAYDQDGVPGLLSLVKETKPEGLQFAYFNQSFGMLTAGNSTNPPLPALARELKAQYPLMGPA